MSSKHVLQQQEQADRQMIRRLLGRYTVDKLERLLQEEGRRSLSVIDTANSLSRTSCHDELTIASHSLANANTFSDTSSACGSIASNTSIRAHDIRGRKRKASPTAHTPSQVLTDESSWEAEDVIPMTIALKQKGSFTCGFCDEEGIKKTCTRKNDLKRHIEDFHHTNAQWFCRQRDCRMVFDWQTAYKAHLRNSHGGSKVSLYDAKVELCPQTVFACGFENCPQVFEAASDADATLAFKEYVGHVVKHFDEGVNGSQWSYSARMRNLIRQSSIAEAFPHPFALETDQSHLKWHPQTSSVLRKRLETRHLGDVQYLIQYALELGSTSGARGPSCRADFVTPVRSECRLALHNHGHKYDRSANLRPETEHDQIPYGLANSDPNSILVAYYTSHNQTYMTQPAQSQLPPTPLSFHDVQDQGIRQQYAMMEWTKTEQPYMDMELSERSLIGQDYGSQPIPDLHSLYKGSGLSSPAPTDPCGAPSHSASVEQSPAYAVYTSSPFAH